MNENESTNKLEALLENEESNKSIMDALLVLSAACQISESDGFSITLLSDNVEWEVEFKIINAKTVEEVCNTVN